MNKYPVTSPLHLNCELIWIKVLDKCKCHVREIHSIVLSCLYLVICWSSFLLTHKKMFTSTICTSLYVCVTHTLLVSLETTSPITGCPTNNIGVTRTRVSLPEVLLSVTHLGAPPMATQQAIPLMTPFVVKWSGVAIPGLKHRHSGVSIWGSDH